jgi:hypothetical protein
MSFALRFSFLPLIDSVLESAFEAGGVECETHPLDLRPTSPEDQWVMRRAATNLQRFSHTKYFAGVASPLQAKSRARKIPD